MTAKTARVTLWALLFAWPASVGHPLFYQVTTPLAVSAEKSHPPYIAFAETQRAPVPDEWDEFENRATSLLTTERTMTIAAGDVIRLEAMRIEKPTPTEMTAIAAADPGTVKIEPEVIAAAEWTESLSKSQRLRLAEAQRRSNVLAEPPPAPSWSDQAARVIATATREMNRRDSAPNVMIGTGSPADGSFRPAVRDVARVEVDPNASAADVTEIEGHLEIADGLGFLGRNYDHHFEVLRSHEGVEVERGAVNVAGGSYSIKVGGRTGRIVARLRDEKGRVLGEDSFYLSQLRGRGRVTGPLLKLTPRTDVAARGESLYPRQPLRGFRADAFSGAARLVAGKNGDFEFNQVQKGSITVLRAEARDHARTVALVHSGHRADVTMFPASWVESLKSIVSEQRQMNLNDPEAAVIWGRVSQDGKPRAGIVVELESDPEREAVYFNAMLLPDRTLRSTSENGLFAIIGAPPGFQALIAKIGESYLAHQNAVVEPGAVSLANLETTMRTEPVPLRVYDAFTGEPRPARLLHQAVEQEVEVGANGSALVSLPVLRRLSLAMVSPELPYARATYLLSDDDGYAHLPLVRDDWIRAVQGWTKTTDVPGTSVVVGFVPDERFTAEALDPEGTARVVYFDKTGNPLNADQGAAGGGFVVFGLSQGVREILVQGLQSGMLSTRVVPSDAGALTVLAIRAD